MEDSVEVFNGTDLEIITSAPIPLARTQFYSLNQLGNVVYFRRKKGSEQVAIPFHM